MLTTELMNAVMAALDEEACEHDRTRRAALLTWTRATFAQWSAGALTAEEAAARIESFRRGLATRPETSKGVAADDFQRAFVA
jgi:hypothetical protein